MPIIASIYANREEEPVLPRIPVYRRGAPFQFTLNQYRGRERVAIANKCTTQQTAASGWANNFGIQNQPF